jgi:hypothetical protein
MRDGIQTRLATIDGLYAYDVEKGAERMPCAIVFPAPGGEWWEVANKAREYEFVVEIHVQLTLGMRKAQDRLDGYIDPTAAGGVQAVILADQTLGGAATVAVTKKFTAYGFSELNGLETLMARVPVVVTV